MAKNMTNRWISLYVENQVGVLAKVSGLFSGKNYNLQSLTVGTTELEDVSRMTICVTSDDITFEQIKKQLNRMVEVIKVVDISTAPLHMKELLYARIDDIGSEEMNQIFHLAEVFKVRVCDTGEDCLILECLLTTESNDELIKLLKKKFKKVSIVRGGAVAIESISITKR